jgi:hypothetical protein
MSTIDPKWLQYDATKLTTAVTAGVNELTLRDDIVIEASVTKINDSKIEIREVSAGAPLDPGPLDFYIETPDKV